MHKIMAKANSGKMEIGFVGGGHMTAAIVAGLHQSNIARRLAVIDRNADKRRRLKARFGASVFADTEQLPPTLDAILLSVKPADMPAACRQLAPTSATIITLAAGIPTSNIAEWLPFSPRRIARAMPNTPAAVGYGMTALYARPPLESKIKKQLSAIFSAVGEVLWVKKEAMLDAATSVSGSGPAYFYYFAEAMQEAAEDSGFSAAESRRLVVQTLQGAGAMLAQNRQSAAELRRAVAVKGGATEQALAVMESAKMKAIVKKAMRACHHRASQLGAGKK